MTISRQHAETMVEELVGRECRALLAASGGGRERVDVLHLLVDDVWVRIAVDAGVLFLDEGDGPDPADDLDDLDEGDVYIDLAEELGCRGETLTAAQMRDGTFSLRMSSGLQLDLLDDDVSTLRISRSEDQG